jgi:uncharacterized lipoprotein YddW (UPF0748 family)
MRNVFLAVLAVTMFGWAMCGCAATETRGIWVDKETLFAPKESVLAFLDALKVANFNSLYLNTYFRGEVLYPASAYLPQPPELNGDDRLAWLLPEIHKRGMRAEAWTEYGFYAFHTDFAATATTRGVILDKFPELTGIDSNGKTYLHTPAWGDFFVLCPVNPKSQQLLLDIFAETLTRYEFDGINLDRIRFARSSYCYCDYCRKKFRADTGFDLNNADPDRVQRVGNMVGVFDDHLTTECIAFLEWRKEQLTDFMRRLSERLRAVRKGIVITSAVAAPEQIDEYGQDWPNWLAHGYLDAAMPMLYAEDVTTAVRQVRRLTRRKNRIFTGLDADGNSPQALVNQIEQARAAGAAGITIWYSGAVEKALPLLRKTVFNEPAKSHFGILFAEH